MALTFPRVPIVFTPSCSLAIAMRTAVPIDLYCYADIDYTVIAMCCNVLYKTHLIAYDGY